MAVLTESEILKLKSLYEKRIALVQESNKVGRELNDILTSTFGIPYEEAEDDMVTDTLDYGTMALSFEGFLTRMDKASDSIDEEDIRLQDIETNNSYIRFLSKYPAIMLCIIKHNEAFPDTTFFKTGEHNEDYYLGDTFQIYIDDSGTLLVGQFTVLGSFDTSKNVGESEAYPLKTHIVNKKTNVIFNMGHIEDVKLRSTRWNVSTPKEYTLDYHSKR